MRLFRRSSSPLTTYWPGVLLPALCVIGFSLLLLHSDPHFFWNDDYQACFLPVFNDVARAWESGEWPLLSPYSWYGGAFAGEYRYGSFSIVFNLLVVVVWKLGLTLPAAAACLSIIHLVILATGAFVLARSRKLAVELATLAAVVAALNGWIITWAVSSWSTSLNSFAWVPWAWWALERALDRRTIGGMLQAGFFLYLILAAGSPFSAMMIGFVSCFQVLRVVFATRRVLDLWPLIGAWIWGIGLATPAILMLLDHLQSGQRSGTLGKVQLNWLVPPSALLGLVAPTFVSEWHTWWDQREMRPAVEMAGGVLPPVILIAALFRLRGSFLRSVRWDLALFAFALAICLLPSVAPFRYSFRWLPLLHLVLGLLGAQAFAALREEESTNLSTKTFAGLGLSTADFLMAVVGFSIVGQVLSLLFSDLFVYLDPKGQVIVVVLALAIVIPLGYWILNTAQFVTFSRQVLPTLLILLSLGVTYSQVNTRWVNRWDFPESMRLAAPHDPDVLYLSIHDRETAYAREASLSQLIRPGNTSMLAGLRWINGYSTIGPAGLTETLSMRSHMGFSTRSQGDRLLEETGREDLLQLMGVDGLVLTEPWLDSIPALLDEGWNLAFSSVDGVILHRAQPSPEVRSIPDVQIVDAATDTVTRLTERGEAPVPWLLVRPRSASTESRLNYATCRVELVAQRRLRTEAHVTSSSPDRACFVAFAQPWYKGYRARLGDETLAVEALNLVVPGVEVPAGVEGTLILEYDPAPLRTGLAIAGSTLLCGLALWIFSHRRQRVKKT